MLSLVTRSLVASVGVPVLVACLGGKVAAQPPAAIELEPSVGGLDRPLYLAAH